MDANVIRDHSSENDEDILSDDHKSENDASEDDRDVEDEENELEDISSNESHW